MCPFEIGSLQIKPPPSYNARKNLLENLSMLSYRLGIIALLLTTVSCQMKTSPPKSEIRVAFKFHIQSLDPRKLPNLAMVTLHSLCFEGLLQLDSENRPVPAIAERWEVSDDFTTYTFFLREAAWSDGQPITAYDFEETWKTILSPSFPSLFAHELYVLKNGKKAKLDTCSIDDVGVNALDARTLRVVMEESTPHFLSLASTNSFFCAPSHITRKNPRWTEYDHLEYVCNGPFHLTQWVPNHLLVFEKNPHYWDKEHIALEKLSAICLQDESTALAMFESDELDLIGNPWCPIPVDAVSHLKHQNALFAVPTNNLYYYCFNTQKPPFNNVHIRRALALAIDRKSLIEHVTQAGEIPATSFISPLLWHQETTYFQDHDVQGALHEFSLGLEELKLSPKSFPPILISSNTSEAHHKVAQAIQEQWHQVLGIPVQLSTNMDWNVFIDALHHHQFDVARMGAYSSWQDPLPLLSFHDSLSNTNNYPQWANPQFLEYLNEARHMPSSPARVEILRKAEALFLSEMPVAPIYFATSLYLKKPHIHGVTYSSAGMINFKGVYLD